MKLGTKDMKQTTINSKENKLIMTVNVIILQYRVQLYLLWVYNIIINIDLRNQQKIILNDNMKNMTSYGCGVAEGNEIYNVQEQNVLFPVK